jgi:hypothetical protein
MREKKRDPTDDLAPRAGVSACRGPFGRDLPPSLSGFSIEARRVHSDMGGVAALRDERCMVVARRGTITRDPDTRGRGPRRAADSLPAGAPRGTTPGERTSTPGTHPSHPILISQSCTHRRTDPAGHVSAPSRLVASAPATAPSSVTPPAT